MRVLVLHHVPHRPVVVQRWAEKNNYQLDSIYCPECLKFPEPDNYDAFIIMGGPMSVNDRLGWLAPELSFIREVIAFDKPVLGICLGAQLIAKAMEARVFSLPYREIGWYAVRQTLTQINPGQSHWLNECLPAEFIPFHWHGDNFDLPSGAVHLYESDGCANQAFAINDHIIGLQFHLDFDSCTTKRVAENSIEELVQGGSYVQSLTDILQASHRFAETNQHLYNVLDRLCALQPIQISRVQ